MNLKAEGRNQLAVLALWILCVAEIIQAVIYLVRRSYRRDSRGREERDPRVKDDTHTWRLYHNKRRIHQTRNMVDSLRQAQDYLEDIGVERKMKPISRNHSLSETPLKRCQTLDLLPVPQLSPLAESSPEPEPAQTPRVLKRAAFAFSPNSPLFGKRTPTFRWPSRSPRRMESGQSSISVSSDYRGTSDSMSSSIFTRSRDGSMQQSFM